MLFIVLQYSQIKIPSYRADREMLMGKTIRSVEGRGEELEKMLFSSISF